MNGADHESAAAAIATAIEESSLGASTALPRID
jgi:hypothetical protein